MCPFSSRSHDAIRGGPPVPRTTHYTHSAQRPRQHIPRADSEQSHLVSCGVTLAQTLEQCKGHILLRVRGRELLFGVGMSYMDAVLQPADVGSAYLRKSPRCLASLPHLASTAGDAIRLEAAEGWQQARSWPLVRIDGLGTNWWRASARTNAFERMESAGALRRSARVRVSVR